MGFENFQSSGPLQMKAEAAERIFNKIIVPAIGARGQRPEHPTLIVVAGQPGSGKSTAIRQAETGLMGATQKIIGDDFDAYVPGYDEMARTEPSNAANHARKAGSGYFVQATLARADSMEANVILECAVPAGSANFASRYREMGHHTELHIVATPHYQSWTGVLDRAERALSKGNIGTNVLCPRKAHDETYAGWARAVFEAEQQMQYDRIVITRRDGNVMYDNQLVTQRDGTRNWAKPTQGLEFLLRERHRAISGTDASRAKDAWDRIVQSPHMDKKTDPNLKSLPLEGYHKEIVAHVMSEGSRVDVATQASGQFSPEALKQWHKYISADLSLARSSRKQFGLSEEFDKRINQYGRRITARANVHYRSTLLARPQDTLSQERSGIRNFSLPTGVERSQVRFDPTGTGAPSVSSIQETTLNKANSPKLEQFKKENARLRTAFRSLRQNSKEFFKKTVGMSQAQELEPTKKKGAETFKHNEGRATNRNWMPRLDQGGGGHREHSPNHENAPNRESSASSRERPERLRRGLDARDRSGRSR